jgi:hypothetical protein
MLLKVILKKMVCRMLNFLLQLWILFSTPKIHTAKAAQQVPKKSGQLGQKSQKFTVFSHYRRPSLIRLSLVLQ